MRRILMTIVLALVAAAALATIAPAAPAQALTRTDAGSTPATGVGPARGQREPLVIGHRGASGYRPEHTLAAYELAARMGADFIEPDLVSTKEGVLVARHEPEIGGTTDVAEHPEFAARRTTKLVDGRPVTGWFTTDFTLAELKTLRAKERLPLVRQENTIWDGWFEVPTFEEVLRLRERLSRELRRTIGVYPETKHPTFFQQLGLALEPRVTTALRRHGLDRPTAPVFVQSFELTNLYTLRNALRLKAPLVFLSGTGAPYDLVAQGDPRTYADLQQPESLAVLARTIDGLGPDKSLVIPRNADGTLSSTPTSLVRDAHAVGLLVHPYTFRAENTFLPADYRLGSDPADHGRAVDEQVRFLQTGIDGLFTDQPDIGVAARGAFLRQR
ncbi:glycerophosphodiester phosphodiesterase [Humibacillus xanthopallidus]|uniref:glycerophosphodiester phosphodiesterase n=1 Tax=Humibacillus xanthopallidus TaxID=412689 RepID=UPI00384D8F7D